MPYLERRKIAGYLPAIVICQVILLAAGNVESQPYKNKALSPEVRAKDMVSRMTLDEKIAQLRSTWSAFPKIDSSLLGNSHIMDSLFGKGIGMINPDFENTIEQTINFRNKIQAYLVNKTRLGIPAIFLDEAHHGLLADKSDVFPTGIGIACMWDTALTEEIYNYVARQCASRGTSMVLAPVIDIARDPRWGRTGETFGEDSYLSGVLGAAVVRGLQGSRDGAISRGHVAATLKHFAGHGQSEGGVNQGPADFSERTLRNFHLEPFRLAIDRAHPAAIMPAYVDIGGIPAHANHWLLKDILAGEWDYQGILVSDWWGIDQLWQKHHVAYDKADAAFQAITAGVTVDLPMGNNYEALSELVKNGRISVDLLNNAARKILELKFRLGLFDRPYHVTLDSVTRMIDRPKGRELALAAAEKSMVLLKNNNNLLPLGENKYKKIAIIGPCAAYNYTGDYSGRPTRNISILEAVRYKMDKKAEIVYSKGVELTLNGDSISLNNFQFIDSIVLPRHEDNLRKIDSAVEVAKSADIIICAVGENEQFSREAQAPHHFGDASSLDLQSDQDLLIKALSDTKKPLIIYLSHGRPLSANCAVKYADAIVDGWFTGEESGNAFARIIFGEVNPSGKLPISVPRSEGQIPIYYNHNPSAQFLPYVDQSNLPLFPFGYGLSYTSFVYSEPRLSAKAMIGGGAITVSVDVSNVGSRAGEEVVQLYVHQNISSATRPIKELKDFARVSLQPGETKSVTFILDPSKLAYWNRDMRYGVEKGDFVVLVGPDSQNLKSATFTVL